MLKNNLYTLVILLFIGCQSNAQKSITTTDFAIQKTKEEWKAILTDNEYYVLRESGTERAFTGKYNKFYKKGTYYCKACNTALFKSNHKFDSGTGWPSFDASIKGNVGYNTDNDLGYTRSEIHCNTCGGHLGHVFNDGPKETTGKRYCVNSVSLNFETK